MYYILFACNILVFSSCTGKGSFGFELPTTVPKQINLAKLFRKENWAFPGDTLKTLLPPCPYCEKQNLIRCVSEKLGVKEFMSRVTSSVSPVTVVGAGSAAAW